MTPEAEARDALVRADESHKMRERAEANRDYWHYRFKAEERRRSAAYVERDTARREADKLRAFVGTIEGVIGEYFDLDADPWGDLGAACPAPEDLWRLHRDLKAAIEREVNR